MASVVGVTMAGSAFVGLTTPGGGSRDLGSLKFIDGSKFEIFVEGTMSAGVGSSIFFGDWSLVAVAAGTVAFI